MYPAVMDFIRREYPYNHPQTKTSYSKFTNETVMDKNDVPKSIIKEYCERRNYPKYIKTLESLQLIFKDLIKIYSESWVKSSKDTVTCNYSITPISYEEGLLTRSMDIETDANHNIFKTVEYFITLQKLPIGKLIPKEIIEFIEQHNALKLLNS